MPESVLDAIRQGNWDFEPAEMCEEEYESTSALPGSDEKIGELATRAREGLPLWHPADRICFDDTDEAMS